MKTIFQLLSSPTDSSFIVKQYYQPEFIAPLHFHHAYELIYIVKSYGKFYGENRVMNFSEGEIYCFGPGFAHCFYNEKSFVATGEMAHSVVIQFTEDFLGKDFFEKPELRKIKYFLHSSQLGIKISKPDDRIKELFMNIRDQQGMESMLSLLELLDSLSQQKNDKLSFVTITHEKNMANDKDSEKMEIIIKYIMENFKEDLNIKKAASIAFLNEAAFCRYFKRRAKKTFSQFVNDVRITHAIRLLSEKDCSISEVCYECGYNNLSYFNRQFRLIVGKTPFEYRKEINMQYFA
jgi:AraC-like DNA-binding protein